MEPSGSSNSGKPALARRGLRHALPGMALVLATLLAVGSCGPDRRNEALGPAGDKIDEPLSKNAQTFTMDASGGSSCALPLKIHINPENLSKVAGGLNVNGSIWGQTGDYGSQRFANGNFHLVTDPNDPTRIIDVTGDGAAVIPFVGAYTDFLPNLAGLRATFGVRKGSELQYLNVPVPNDSKCYFLASLKAADLGFEASGKSFDFSVTSTYLVIDPSDPLVYFVGNLTRVPFLINGTGLTKVAMAISAGGHLESTARAIPDKIVSGHLFFGATYQLGRTATISGDVFVRFPDFSSASPQFTVSTEGSVYLGGQIVTTAFSAVIPGFTSDTLHIGDGTSIVTIGADRHNGQSQATGGVRIEFAVRSADILGNLTKLVGLDNVIRSSGVAFTTGFVDTINPGFAFAMGGDVSVSVLGAIGMGLTERIGVASSPPSASFRLESSVDFGLFSVNIGGDIDPVQGTFNVTGSAGFDATCCAPLTSGLRGHASITIAYPAGANVEAGFDVCIAGGCIGEGFSVTLGPHPEFCIDTFGCIP